jgi:hypothetical protein
VASKKVGGGKTPPKTTAKKPLTAYQKAVSGPAKSAGKAKLKPYDSKWKSDVAKNSKRTGLDKFAEGVLALSPLAAIKYGAEAVTGKSMDGPAGNKKKVGRVGAAANAAFVLTPLKGAGKVGKVVKTVRSTKGALNAKQGNTSSVKGKKVFDGYVDSIIRKEMAKMNRTSGKKTK